MALAGQAVAPARRAVGMGVFFTLYHAIMMLVPPLAGRVLDTTGQAQAPISMAVALFGTVILAVAVFGWVFQRSQRAAG